MTNEYKQSVTKYVHDHIEIVSKARKKYYDIRNIEDRKIFVNENFIIQDHREEIYLEGLKFKMGIEQKLEKDIKKDEFILTFSFQSICIKHALYFFGKMHNIYGKKRTVYLETLNEYKPFYIRTPGLNDVPLLESDREDEMIAFSAQYPRIKKAIIESARPFECLRYHSNNFVNWSLGIARFKDEKTPKNIYNTSSRKLDKPEKLNIYAANAIRILSEIITKNINGKK